MRAPMRATRAGLASSGVYLLGLFRTDHAHEAAPGPDAGPEKAELVRAAVTIALDAALPNLIGLRRTVSSGGEPTDQDRVRR